MYIHMYMAFLLRQLPEVVAEEEVLRVDEEYDQAEEGSLRRNGMHPSQTAVFNGRSPSQTKSLQRNGMNPRRNYGSLGT